MLSSDGWDMMENDEIEVKIRVFSLVPRPTV